jgi:predicted Zn-dependent protease
MLSGNVYETLSNVEAVENKALNLGIHKLPALLCKDVSVAGK